MTIDEMIIQVRVTAEGVKQGVAVAAGELKKLEAEKERLRQDLKFKLEAPELLKLKQDLADLQAKKRELETAVKFPVEGDGLKALKQELAETVEEKKMVEKDLKIHMSLEDMMAAKTELERLEKEKHRLESEIKLKITTDAEAAKKDLSDVNKSITDAERQISIHAETSGLNEASAKLKEVTGETKNAAKASEELDKAITKAGVAAAAAFYGIVSAAKEAVEAYTKVVEAQTKLSHIMGLTMNATSGQVGEIINITKEYQKMGVISATAQQAGAQELATYITKTETLKKLIPIMNDMNAQQNGYNASAGQAVTIATMLGKVMDGQVGGLKRYGYSFTEAQEAVLKTGTESERVATIMDVVSSSVGGMNKALRETDPGQIKALANETVRLNEAWGGALIPSIAGFSSIMKEITSGAADFAEKNKAVVAGLTTLTLVIVGGIALMGILKAKLTEVALAGALAAAANPFVWLAGVSIAGLVALTTATLDQSAKQEELTKKTEEYYELLNSQTTGDNVEAKKSQIEAIQEEIDSLDELIAKLKEEEAVNQRLMGDGDGDARLRGRVYLELISLAEKYNATITESMTVEEMKASVTAAMVMDQQALADAEREYAESLRFTAGGMAKNIEETQNLISAYEKLSKGGELSAEELLKFSEMYPAVSKHISENINWRETLIDVIKKEITVSREAHLQEIANKKAKIEMEAKELQSMLKLSSTQHEYAQQRINDIRKEKELLESEYKILEDSLTIKDSLGNETKSLSEKSKELASSINSLESGYKALKDGQSLSLDTVLDLINNYPSLAHYIAETGDLTFKNGEMLKSVAKIKAETHLEELRLSKESVDNEITAAKNRATVFQREMSAKIDAFSAFYKVFNGGKEGGPTPINNAHIVEMEKQSKDLAAQMAATEKFIGSIDSFGASSTKAAKESTKAQKDKNEALEKEIKLLEDKKALTQMSASDEIAEWERIKAAYAKTAEEKQDIDKKTYALRLKLNDEWLDNEMKAIAKMNSGREESTDYSAIINKLEETLAEARIKYAEYPETLKKIEETLTDDLEAAYKDRAKKLLKIDSKSVDDRIKEQERLNAVEKGRQGITEDDNKIFTENQARYDLLVQNEKDLTDAQKQEMENRQKIIENTEIEGKRKLLLIETQRLEELQKKGAELTDDEKAEYDSRMAQAKKYMEDIEDLTNGHLQKILDINKKAVDDQAKADKKAADDATKALAAKIKEQEDIRKAANKIVIDDIKSRYAEEIKLAEAAANAEIKVYSDKIKAIDDLLKAESREEADSEQLDRINRLKEQLKFEKDDANIYELQKQIGQEQADFDKRKRREGLEDEKSTLQDKINAVKDNVADQKKALEELREAEIAYAEQSLEAYIAKLSNENAEKKIAVEAETEIIKKELGVQEVNNKTSIDKLYKQEEKGQKEKRTLLQQYTDKFVKDLNNKINDFADAGRKAGQAYAQAFREATENIMSSVSSSANISASMSSATSAAASNAMVQNITFTMPVATPSKVAAETAYALELMARNI